MVVRNPNLRWPVTKNLARRLRGERVRDIRRRGKYLLFDFPRGHLLVHLGMSGRLTVVPAQTAPRKHDHVDIVLDDGKAMRLNDPRRFGAVLWLDSPARGMRCCAAWDSSRSIRHSAAPRSTNARGAGASRSSNSS